MRHVELIQKDNGSWTAIVDGRFADELCREEALGVVAAVIYGNTTYPPYVRSYSSWLWWREKYCGYKAKIAGLLTHSTGGQP